MEKIHYLTEISDESNYLLACGLKYKDSDNITFSKNKKEVTCKSCLMLMKGLDKTYTTKELLDFLWKVVEKVKKQPELASHHRFAKDYANLEQLPHKDYKKHEDKYSKEDFKEVKKDE